MKKDDLTLVLIVAVAVAIFFIFRKKIAEINPFESEDKKLREAAIKSVDQRIMELELDGMEPTSPWYVWQNRANQIHKALKYSMISDDKSAAERVLKTVNNTLDLLLLIKAYGERWTHMLGVPDGLPKTLPELIPTELSAERINRINSYYVSKGIGLTF